MPENSTIQIKGARCHNLKNLDLEIGLGKLTVITGVSGSGKSSLAFDTIYAEGQRRYVETFSPYTRQFLERMDKPQVDRIDGIPPAIALSQANSIRTSRSTVGTLTEISDYLKLLMARKAKLYSPQTGREIRPWKPDELCSHLIKTYRDQDLIFGITVDFQKKTKWKSICATLKQQGMIRYLNEGEGKILRLEEDEKLTLKQGEEGWKMNGVLTRLRAEPKNKARIAESIEQCFKLSPDQSLFIVSSQKQQEKILFSSSWKCPDSGQTFTTPSPSLFTFNNPVGACPKCRGFGRTVEIDYDLALPDRTLSIGEGVVKPFQTESNSECQEDLEKACRRKKIPLSTPFHKLPKAAQKFVLEGEPGEGYKNRWYGVKGFFKWLESRTYKVHVRVLLARYRAYRICDACNGTRYQPELNHWKLNGWTLHEINTCPLNQLQDFFNKLKTRDKSEQVLIDQLKSRTNYLNQVGLGYLTLNRAARTLSGGEIQRVNLTTCLGSSLVGTLFVLDEPSIGLHPRDTTQLIQTLTELTDRGNTTLVVEHDDQFMKSADELIELGPRAGEKGGSLVAQGHWSQLKPAGPNNKGSLSAAYLNGDKEIPLPTKRRPITKGHPTLTIKGAEKNNLKGVDVDLPLRRFVAISGVSGSGKSTLLHDIVYKEIKKALHQPVEEPGKIKSMKGASTIDTIHIVDQSPLAKTPRSTPLLYLGCYDDVRNLYAQTEEALRRGLRAGSFSFNSGDGRCNRCQGTGFEKITMQFLSDLYVRCPICEGKRFQKHVLEIKWFGSNIHELLEMTIDEGIEFFRQGLSDSEEPDPSEKSRHKACSNIIRQISLLSDVGLGYLRLGQPLTQLSGGESQRLKLIQHLTAAIQKKEQDRETVLILDEPTTGLHFDDTATLIRVLNRIVDQGISLFVIEHNLDLIKCADHVLDIGPEAGDRGGQIVAKGTPEEVAKAPGSYTGQYLKPLLQKKKPSKKVTPPSRRTQTDALETIQVRGASHHNLKNIDVDIPRHQMVVVTGLSGSGKSTLAFDLLFAEGQRRYLDCLNTYARQFMEQMEKPAVDAIHGLPPTVAIEQRTTRGGAKSTVATVTEIYHFLRLLYSKIGVQHDPETGEKAIQQSADEIIKRVKSELSGSQSKNAEIALLAPLVKNRKGIYTELGRWAVRKNLPYLRVDGEWIPPEKFEPLDRYREHHIDAVLGNIQAGDPQIEVLINQALDIGNGTIYTIDNQSQEKIYSTELFCPGTGRSFESLDPRLFSYNSPYGWCQDCQGYGTITEVKVDPRLEGVEREAAIEEALEAAKTGQEVEEVDQLCPTCHGSRLNEVARAVHFAGKPVTEWNHLSVDEFAKAFDQIKLNKRETEIARDILPEIRQRLYFLQQVGLGYLQLDRSATTLSGGESQRIRLAAQLGSNLQGVLYVLDEPTIGLHPRDNEQLISILSALKDRGNSLVVVEHDDDTMKRADQIIDLGPAAGIHGGEIIAQGHWKELIKQKSSTEASQTAQLLGEPIPHPMHGNYREVKSDHPSIQIKGACVHNLKKLNIRIPRNRLVVLSGVSGSGKSTLMHEVLRPAVESCLNKPGKHPSSSDHYHSVSGAEGFDRVMEMTQAPIGKTSRSTVATYIGLMDHLRNLYASIPLAQTRGFKKGHFSYNSGQGRCPACQGQGTIKVEMNFLPPTYVPCDQCHGRRWTEAILDVEFQGYTIYDTLNLSVDEAVEIFANLPKVAIPLRLLQETGLGYLKIGQTSPTLSGGEAQRLKLVAELAVAEQTRQRHILKSSDPKLPENLYLLEEPTVGLHLADVRKLLELMHRLVDAGHTVVVIEHHLDVIAEADHIIDIGPEAGTAGGEVVIAGTVVEVAACKRSHTAPFLQSMLSR